MNINKLLRSLAAGLLSCVIAVGNCDFTAFSADSTEKDFVPSAELVSAMENDYYTIEPVDAELPSFSRYYDAYADENRPDCEILVKGADYSSCSGDFAVGDYSADGTLKKNVLIWGSSDGEITYDITVPESGIYCLSFSYCGLVSNSSAVELSMKIDGKLPCDTASRITLNRVWVNEKDIFSDSRGNQVRPSQVQKEMWQNCWAGDVEGLFSEPLFFYLGKGEHQVCFSSERAQFALESFRFANPKELPSYSEYAGSLSVPVSVDSTPSRLFRIEGENAAYKSDSTLYPTSDNNNYLVSPSNPRKVVYNTIGGGNWKKALQSVTWTIPKEAVGNDGWYKIGIKARQNQLRGFCSNRRLLIDGKVPCEEMNCLKFHYDNDWNVVSPRSDGDYVYVYLDASFDHTLTLEAVPGEIGDSMRRLEDVVSELNTCYRQVLMITGPTPDKYTDYYVHEKLPDLVSDFGRLSDELKDIQDSIEELADSSGSEAAALENMAVILDKCVDKPLKIPSYLPQIKDCITSLSSWMRDCRDQPLEVDYIEFASQDRDFASCKRKLGKSIKFGIAAFIGSFFEDYTTLSDITGENAIEVWVSLGRDQAQVVKEMVESDFIPKFGIPVSVNLVVGGVVEASLAGKGPDVALFIGGEFPVNLACRDLLVDMSQFEDFGEVKKRFQKNATSLYSYNGGCYGIPITQSFPMMFYRTDVLTELGYDHPPETWDELTDMLPAIQRNYMNVGLVLPPTNISPATEAGHTFALLMLQRGLNYYNDSQTRSTFDSTAAVQAFEQWTDFYTKYSFTQSYDAFSRFRTGEYPIVISNYSFYNQLAVASPEIKGLWNFCQVPGTPREDGSVSHAANSNGSGAVIFSKVDNAENAWKFVKWFTDTNTQVRFGTQLEGLLGTMGRFDTANLEALGQLSWSEDELARLRDQQEELEEIPIIPSSYAVTRNIMNAFRETVNELHNCRDTLIWYNRDINDEITRKRKNLGLSTDED